jgi:TolB-like protein/DNA-binding SARP family transcriptional activator/Tfp pilus assembly protein PilF
MSRLHVRLFGGFELGDAQGNELTLATRKSSALLAFLIIEADRWHTRERLAGLLWSDRQTAQARHSLTQSLGTIRKLGDRAGVSLIESDSDRVRLQAAGIEADALSFRHMLEGDPMAAADLYTGPLLDGFSAREAPFEEWLAMERASFHEQACGALGTATDQAEARGDAAMALAAAKRWLVLDPCAEPAHRRLMQLHVAAGRRGEAVRQYQECERLLREDLGVEPSAETRALIRDIRAQSGPDRDPAIREAAPPPPIADGSPNAGRSSIAVLPFVNMSGDPDQEYFSDGITEDIITALSNVRTLTVLSRNATFVYKGQSVDPRQIAERFNVNYMIEGSVRRVGDRVRVTAQLTSTATGDHVWAQRYDGTVEDIFEFQDRITSKIVATIEPELIRAEGLRLQGRPPDSMAAYDWLLRGQAYMYKVTQEDAAQALKCFERAIQLDPNYGRAYAFSSWFYRRKAEQFGLLSLTEEERQKAVALARKAINCDRNDPFVLQYSAATFAFLEHDYDEALALSYRALSINPNSPRFWNGVAKFSAFKGDTKTAIEAAERSISISPNDPGIWVAYQSIAEAHLQELRFAEAIAHAKRAIRHNAQLGPAFYILAAASAHMGKVAEARDALAAALKLTPEMTLAKFVDSYDVSFFKNVDAYLDGLRKAGLPEH